MRNERQEIPRRPFGRSGDTVSIIGLGGFHLGKVKQVSDAVRVVHAAIDAGITFMDNPWEYYEGRSEDLMGRALADRRDRVFLMTKQNVRIASGFEPLTESEMDTLRRRVSDAAADGRFELYKTTAMHEASEGRRQHDSPTPEEVPA
jgi:aryl-alcohol dehydrogenase-like predicted oxidoreductase